MNNSKIDPKSYDWLFILIEDIESREVSNSTKFNQSISGELLYNARCAERMKAWEKVIYWALDGVYVS